MEIELKYQETLDYLYSFVDYSLTKGFRYSPDKFELGRMVDFMEYLGRPDLGYPIIHVAGTKGKGSVSAMCASALQAAGYRVGLYTSPHLTDYAERICVDNEPISHEDLIGLVEEIKPFLSKGTQLTTFEITTALGFMYFARQKVTAAVVEVGLGGRLDATNIVTPVVSVITSISYDHVQILGNTLAEIAGEKAGIIKPGVPVVVSPQPEEARLVIQHVADTCGAPLIQVDRDCHYSPLSHSLQSQTFLIWAPSDALNLLTRVETSTKREWQTTRLTIPLLGHHQIENAATAYMALQIARTHGVAIDNDAIRRGFERVKWPGRFELLQKEPPIVVDCAHNRDSALKLRLTLDEYFPGLPVVLVFGVSEDKDIQGMLIELMPRVEQVIVTKSEHPRAMEPEQLAELVRPFERPIKIVEHVKDAVQEAIRMADRKAMVLITGSIFIAALARDTWYNQLRGVKE